MRFTPKFLLSATSPDHFPDEKRTAGAPEVAFLGRSNVGKSSLINKLLGSKEAKVSSTPGRTSAINFFALHEGTPAKHNLRPSLIFADLPGYGYAKISKSISAEWPVLHRTLSQEREQLALCVCLVDTNIPPQESDTLLLTALQPNAAPAPRSRHQIRPALRKHTHQVYEGPQRSPRRRRHPSRVVKTEKGVKALWPEIVSVMEN